MLIDTRRPHLVRGMTVGVLVAGLGAASVLPAEAASSKRIAGSDRVATSLAVYEQNRDVFTSDTVVLTRGDQFADALAAAPLAAALKAPVILTMPRRIDEQTIDALKRQHVEKVVVVGGTTAVSDAAVGQLGKERMQVERIAGADRFSTAVAAASRTISALPTRSADVYVADGLTPNDALVAGAIAGRDGGVVVLSAGPRLTGPTRAFLQSQSAASRVGIGDAGSRAANTLGLAQSAVGSNGSATSAEVASRWYKPATSAIVSSTNTWPDSLSGAPLAALRRIPLLLVDGRSVSAPMQRYLKASSINQLTILGGTRGVSESMEKSLLGLAKR